MDITFGLAQALAVKDNRIFTLEQRRSDLFIENEQLKTENAELKEIVAELRHRLEGLEK